MPGLSLNRRMASVLDLRPGESARLAPLVLAYAMVMMSVYVLKPARNALFLNSLGIEQLPYVLLLVAAIGGVSASIFSRFSHTIRIDRLIRYTFLFLLVNLAAFRFLLPVSGGWAYYLFYVWVNLYGLTAISLLWLLASAVFNAREARRLFGLIGSGGIAGAILGGLFTGWAVRYVGTENLLVVCMGLLAACTLLVSAVRINETAALRPEEDAPGLFDCLKRYELLRWLGLMAALAGIVAAVADVQFNQIVDAAFATKDEKTAFFGRFFAYLNGFTLLFQIFVTPRILSRLGVGAAMLCLPLSLGLGSLGVLLFPGLAGGIAVKVGDVGFRHSIHRSAAEILFLPLPAGVKRRTKMLLDTAVDNLATGLGAGLILLLVGWLGMLYHHLSLISLAVIALWFGILFRSRKAYLDAFRLALERREIDPGELSVGVSEAGTSRTLISALSSTNTRRVAYALDLLASTNARVPATSLLPLLAHPDVEIRRRATRAALNVTDKELDAPLGALASDPDPDVRVAAMSYLCLHAPEGPVARMQVYLADVDPVVRASAVGCVSAYGDADLKALVDREVLESLLTVEGEAGRFAREQAARAVGDLADSQLHDLLEVLRSDPSPAVVRAAIQSVGKTRNPVHVPWLLDALADRRLRLAARSALSAMEAPVVPLLADALDDVARDFRSRVHIPRVLSDIPTQASVDVLVLRLGGLPSALELAALKAANRLRNRSGDLTFGRNRLEALLFDRTRSIYELLQVRVLLDGEPRSPATRLLGAALAERFDRSVEGAFRILGLCYNPDDIYNAYLGFVSEVHAVKASAVEFLDNLLDRKYKSYLLPILDPPSKTEALSAGRQLFGQHVASAGEALESLIEGEDRWLCACALNCLTPSSPSTLLACAGSRMLDPDPVVAETAKMVCRRLGLGGTEHPGGADADRC